MDHFGKKDISINNTSPLSKKILLFLLATNIFVFFNVNTLSLYRGISIFIVLLYLVVIFFNGRIKYRIANYFFHIWTIVIYLLLSMAINNGGIGSAINYVYGFIIILAFSKYRFNQIDYKLITVMMLLLNLFWVANSKGYFLKVIYGGVHNINPNVVAYLILYSSMLLICIISKKIKNRNKNIFLFTILLLSYYGIIMLNARGSLIALVFFTIVNFIVPTKSILKKTKYIKISYLVIVIVGITFPLVYLNMYKQGIEYTIPLINKSLYTGREIIWQSFFLSMDNPVKWLFGLGSNAELIGIKEQMDLHNNYLAILANFGIVGFIVFYGFIYKIIKEICKTKQISQFSLSLILGFGGVLIHGFFEATIYFAPIFVFMYIYLGLAMSEEYYLRSESTNG